MKIKKEFKIGLFTIAIFVVFYFGMSYLGKKEALSLNNTYYMPLNDAIGISNKTIITLQGVKVGEVSDITLSIDGKKVYATLLIYSRYQIPKGSVISLSPGGILDKAAFAIQFSNNTDFLKDKDTIQYVAGKASLMSQIEPIVPKIDSIMENINTAIGGVNQILSQRNINNISTALEKLHILIENLNNTTVKLDKLIAQNDTTVAGILSNTLAISQNLKEDTYALNRLLQNADSTIVRLKTVSTILSTDMKDGKLLRNMENDTLYKNLNYTLRNLDSLLIDVRKQPEDYVHFSLWGKKKKK